MNIEKIRLSKRNINVVNDIGLCDEVFRYGILKYLNSIDKINVCKSLEIIFYVDRGEIKKDMYLFIRRNMTLLSMKSIFKGLMSMKNEWNSLRYSFVINTINDYRNNDLIEISPNSLAIEDLLDLLTHDISPPKERLDKYINGKLHKKKNSIDDMLSILWHPSRFF